MVSGVLVSAREERGKETLSGRGEGATRRHEHLLHHVRDMLSQQPGYFLSFETFVLFAQAPDEGN